MKENFNRFVFTGDDDGVNGAVSGWMRMSCSVEVAFDMYGYVSWGEKCCHKIV